MSERRALPQGSRTVPAVTIGTATFLGSHSGRRGILKFRVTNDMVVAAAGTSDKITVCTILAKTIVHQGYLAVVTAADQAATLTGSLGPSDDTDGYVVASNLKAAANTVYGATDATMGDDLFDASDDHYLNPLKSYTATTAIQCEFAIGAGTLADVTSCSFDVYLDVTVLP